MEILSSIEVRWFLDDVTVPAAAAARAWFQGVPAEGKREDRYLVTGRDDIAFKVRVQEGKPAKAETKYLVGSIAATQLHERFVGNIERWHKISIEVGAGAVDTSGKSGTWLCVKKKRRLRKLAYEDRIVKAVDTGAQVDAGCGVELTELEYMVHDRWRSALTVGLEAFGPEPMLLDVLLRVCESTFEPAADLVLGADSSASYPRWLRRVLASLA